MIHTRVDVPRRQISIVAVCALAIPLLAGCVPVRGNEAPIAMTVSDESVKFHWCGEQTQSLRHILIEYRTLEPASESLVAAEGTGEFRLRPGDTFSTSEPPREVAYSVSQGVPLSDEDTRIFVYAGWDSDNLSALMVSFESSDLGAWSPGTWLQPSGEKTASPCPE